MQVDVEDDAVDSELDAVVGVVAVAVVDDGYDCGYDYDYDDGSVGPSRSPSAACKGPVPDEFGPAPASFAAAGSARFDLLFPNPAVVVASCCDNSVRNPCSLKFASSALDVQPDNKSDLSFHDTARF